MIKKIKNLNYKKIKIFIDNIGFNGKFRDNKKIENSPWKFIDLKNFNFFSYEYRNKIIGIIVVSNHKKNTHINFLYVLRKYRSKKIGSKLIKYVENFTKNFFLTVHVFKKSKIIEGFYIKNNFEVYCKSDNLYEFIHKANKYDKNVYKKKKLFVKKLKN